MFDRAPWVDWNKDVIEYRENNPEANFFNEVLGLEYDEGVLPVTEEELKACCTGGPLEHEPNKYYTGRPTYMGIDYGPINSKNSYTVVTIITRLDDGKFKLVYAKRYAGAEANYAYIHENVPKLYTR